MLHVRLNFVTADPQRLDPALAYIENEARPFVEDRVGNSGMSLAVNRELGTALVASYWISGDAMRESEHSVAATRAEALKRGAGTISLERFEVPSFVTVQQPAAGAGMRFSWSDFAPKSAGQIIIAYEDIALPWLTEADNFCTALLFIDRRAGRAISETLWRDSDALAASRSRDADVRSDLATASGIAIRGLEEYQVVFNSARPA
jgi:hypothetical protein